MALTRIRVGKLRKRIIIETAASTRDRVGSVTKSWSTFATAWAAVSYLPQGRKSSGDDDYSAGELQSLSVALIKIRYVAGIKPGMRVNYGGRFFAITKVTVANELNRMIEITAEERL